MKKDRLILIGLLAGALFRYDIVGAYKMNTDEVKEIIEKLKKKYPYIKVPTSLILAIIDVESRFNPKAESYAGAKGLMQLMPGTYQWILERYHAPIGDIFDPESNILAGSLYLTYLIQHYGWTDGIMAYNMGPGNIKIGRKNYVYLAKVMERLLRWIF